MDWAALGSRDAVLAVCEHFRLDFAQAEERAAAAEDDEDGGETHMV
jgi:hypothetical protein